MKLAYLVEVTALLSAHSRLLIEQARPIPNVLLGDYYIRSRNRFNRWMRDLNDLESCVQIRDPLHLIGLSPLRPPIQSLTEQILINDLVNRVWTIMLAACDRHRREDRIEPLANNVHRGHMTVRHKALGICLNDKSLTSEQLIHIDRLRSSTERWSDLLSCTLMAEYDLWSYAFDKVRSREFFHDRFQQDSLESRSPAWTLILAGLRHSFPDVDGLAAPLHEDDRAIIRLMLDCFPKDTQEMAFWSGPAMARAQVVT
ncbi:MAG: hypothetical protein R3C19_22865 [Planctomycetaceae bacterium]